jgi:hypothetical protein
LANVGFGDHIPPLFTFMVPSRSVLFSRTIEQKTG